MRRPKKIVEATAVEVVAPKIEQSKDCFNCGKSNSSILSARGHWFCCLHCQATKGE